MKKYYQSEYSKKLRDPRWQKKRLEIMLRDDFCCKICGNSTDTLNVHHCYYGDKDPWDYESTSLITLCEICHKDEDCAKIDKKALIDSIAAKGGLSSHFNELACAISESGITHFDDFYVSSLAWSIRNEEIRMIIQEMYYSYILQKGL